MPPHVPSDPYAVPEARVRARHSTAHALVLLVQSVGIFRCQIEQVHARVISSRSSASARSSAGSRCHLAVSVRGQPAEQSPEEAGLQKIRHRVDAQPRACAVTPARQDTGHSIDLLLRQLGVIGSDNTSPRRALGRGNLQLSHRMRGTGLEVNGDRVMHPALYVGIV